MSPRTLYHTTPIYYVNDVPHPGHAYTTVAADALARARRLRGDRVYFLTGTDEHGQNIARIAEEKGLPPQEYCDRIAAVFRALWNRLDIRYDGFIRTTDEVHKRGVVKLWGRIREANGPDGRPVIYRGTYAGWYCPRCEAFYDEDELRQPGNLCPVHERPAEWTEEENFFFRLSAYSDWLRTEIEAARILIEPVGRRNEVLAVIRLGLKDFSVSRARVKWGIPVPEEPSHVFYVWMDALFNYVTALGYAADAPLYRTFWEQADERLHFIGKEIIRFHCLYWPAMLKAAGVPVPTRLFAHGWLTKGGKKLSKTTGNTIDPDVLIDRYGSDAFRYFFLREGSFGQDWDYTDEAFVKRYNSDLANDLGNLVSRALTMAARYCGGRVPAPSGTPAVPAVDSAAVFARYDALDFSGALEAVWSAVSTLNQRIVARAPWEVAKDPARKDELDAFLYALLEDVRLVALLAGPVIPAAAARVRRMLGLADAEPGPGDLEWGFLRAGTALGALEPLFPRIETKEANVSESRTPPPESPGAAAAGPSAPAAGQASPPAAGHATQAAAPPLAGIVDIADFAKIELRAARITAAERVAGSKKLIKLQVDLGGETRQVVAGIAESYAPEALVGRSVVLVANLEPAKLMGVESNGMVLAASIDGRAVLCTFEGEVPPGAKVK